MSRELFKNKICKLSDDKLIELLRVGKVANKEIFSLATEEAKIRNLSVGEIVYAEQPGKVNLNAEDQLKLRKWNWGAFLLGPLWALANKLDVWAILSLIPVVNVFAVFYLGLRGNKLAFERSNLVSVDDFLIIQKQWKKWAVRIWMISIALGIIWFIIDITW